MSNFISSRVQCAELWKKTVITNVLGVVNFTSRAKGDLISDEKGPGKNEDFSGPPLILYTESGLQQARISTPRLIESVGEPRSSFDQARQHGNIGNKQGFPLQVRTWLSPK